MENVSVMDAYSVPAVVEYLQFAFSFVVTDMVGDPVATVPVGAPLLRTGGVVSAPNTMNVIVKSFVFAFPAPSMHLT